MKKAALLAAKAMQNWVVPKVEEVVDAGECPQRTTWHQADT